MITQTLDHLRPLRFLEDGSQVSLEVQIHRALTNDSSDVLLMFWHLTSHVKFLRTFRVNFVTMSCWDLGYF